MIADLCAAAHRSVHTRHRDEHQEAQTLPLTGQRRRRPGEALLGRDRAVAQLLAPLLAAMPMRERRIVLLRLVAGHPSRDGRAAGGSQLSRHTPVVPEPAPRTGRPWKPAAMDFACGGNDEALIERAPTVRHAALATRERAARVRTTAGGRP